jgi:AcrR family transcriptional regulator
MVNINGHQNAERILQDSWVLFQRKGYLGVSMDEICETCSITKPTLYYYFKNKESLFVEVLIRRIQGFHQVIELEGRIEDILVRVAKLTFDSFETDYSFLVKDLAHIKNPEFVKIITETFSHEFFQPVKNLMQHAVDQGQLHGDATFLAQLYMGIIKSFIARDVEFGYDHQQLAIQLVDFFIKGARPS